MKNRNPNPGIRTHLRTLPFSHVTCADFPRARAALWLGGAAVSGWPLPLALARDMGLLLSFPDSRLKLEKPVYLPSDEDTSDYLNFLQRISMHPLVRELSLWKPPVSDAVISVILARLIHNLDMPDMYRPPGGRAGPVFTRMLATQLEQSDPAHIWRNTRIQDRPRWNKLLSPGKLARMESNLQKLDRTEIRFLLRYGPPDAGSPDPRVLSDMLALTDLPGPVRLALIQTLRLLPRVSPIQTKGGVQTYPEGGYEGLARKGSMDSLLLTELVYPDDIFLHRLFNNKALYYGRESSRDRRRELAYIVVQAGWGLGLDGRVMARSLTLGLAQAMSRRGYDVQCSFAGQDLGLPFRPDKPGEVERILHYREKGKVNEEKVLRGVLRQLRKRQDRYQGRQVLWVLGEHFDADWHEAHESLYQDLRSEGGQRAWYIHVGKTGTVNANPPTARYFEDWHLLETGLMWEGREDDSLAD